MADQEEPPGSERGRAAQFVRQASAGSNLAPAPVIDTLAERSDVDADRVAIMGRSFGGYLAPRAASGKTRLAAVIADPAQYDIGAALTERLPKQLLDAIDDDSAKDAFEKILEAPGMRRLLAPRMATHGSQTVQEYARSLLEYTLEGHAEHIACPTLACDNETDVVSMGQGKVVYDHLTCPKDYILFTAAEGAEGHCEGLAPIVFFERAYDWLDQTL